MGEIKTYEILGYAREEKTEEKRREGDMMVTVKTVVIRNPIERVRGVIVPLSDDGGFRRDSHGDQCLVTGTDESFLRNLRAVDFRNLSLGKDNRTYYVMNDGSEYDDDREEVPGDPSWTLMDDVLGEVTE